MRTTLRSIGISLLLIALFVFPAGEDVVVAAHVIAPEATTSVTPASTNIFPAPHNVTLTIGEHDVLFIGYDLNQRIETHAPSVLENDTAVGILNEYRDLLLFMHKDTCEGRYVAFVGLNESCYVEVLVECGDYAPPDYDLGPVLNVEVFSGPEYLESMKTAWLSVLAHNETIPLNITTGLGAAPTVWFIPFLWSYDYTGCSFAGCGFFKDYQDEENLQRLHELHWEFYCVSWRTYIALPSPTVEERFTCITPTVVSVTTDGVILQKLAYMITAGATSSGGSVDYLAVTLVAGAGVATVMIVSLLVRRRQRSAG